MYYVHSNLWIGLSFDDSTISDIHSARVGDSSTPIMIVILSEQSCFLYSCYCLYYIGHHQIVFLTYMVSISIIPSSIPSIGHGSGCDRSMTIIQDFLHWQIPAGTLLSYVFSNVVLLFICIGKQLNPNSCVCTVWPQSGDSIMYRYTIGFGIIFTGFTKLSILIPNMYLLSLLHVMPCVDFYPIFNINYQYNCRIPWLYW